MNREYAFEKSHLNEKKEHLCSTLRSLRESIKHDYDDYGDYDDYDDYFKQRYKT